MKVSSQDWFDVRKYFRPTQYKIGEKIEIFKGQYAKEKHGVIVGFPSNNSSISVKIAVEGHDEPIMIRKASIRRQLKPDNLSSRFKDIIVENPKIYEYVRLLADELAASLILPQEIELEEAIIEAISIKGE